MPLAGRLTEGNRVANFFQHIMFGRIRMKYDSIAKRKCKPAET
ncbi:hypothetical protein HNR65_001695 [Desulfosalsimonas propionicica]|uniref:Uncharacterized protein n=1 Tax=Desulfosalsimonas propionicica TaxID=332175 RepID=A0A7W0C8Y7_9BACT|nr:hypothetical protein [Desulfosalsimonas propionicica]